MKNLIGAVTGAILLAGSASAATLSITGGTDFTLPGGSEPVFNPAPAVAGLAIGTTVQNGDNVLLSYSSAKKLKITYTFVGKEAGAVNTAMDGGSVTNRDAVGSSFSNFYAAGTGLVDLDFTSTTGETAQNGGPNSTFGGLAFYAIDSNSVYALFDDGTSNIDYDDMIVQIDVAAVPLPAGAALMLTALGGFGIAARRRK